MITSLFVHFPVIRHHIGKIYPLEFSGQFGDNPPVRWIAGTPACRPTSMTRQAFWAGRKDADFGYLRICHFGNSVPFRQSGNPGDRETGNSAGDPNRGARPNLTDPTDFHVGQRTVPS